MAYLFVYPFYSPKSSDILRHWKEQRADPLLVTVLDGHPATLGWLGGVAGHRVRALGVSRFGQTGTVADLYRHHGIDAAAIVAAAAALRPGRPIRHARSA